MKIEVEISEKGERFLGPNYSEKVAKLAEKEAQRLWHIERCKPKTRPVRPLGRPPLAPEVRKAREIARIVGGVYIDLRRTLGNEAFERLHGADYRKLTEAIAHDDLSTLIDFEKGAPWQNRR